MHFSCGSEEGGGGGGEGGATNIIAPSIWEEDHLDVVAYLGIRKAFSVWYSKEEKEKNVSSFALSIGETWKLS